MGFKEQVALDRHAVFVNLAEFGETHSIDRKDVRCVIDQMDRGERDFQTGLASDGMRIFAKSEDMPPRRGPGMPISVDGVAYMVETWADEMGVAEVSCIRSM